MVFFMYINIILHFKKDFMICINLFTILDLQSFTTHPSNPQTILEFDNIGFESLEQALSHFLRVLGLLHHLRQLSNKLPKWVSCKKM